MTKIVVDGEVCVGCGSCVGAAPEVFSLNEDSKSVVAAGFDYDSAEEGVKEQVDVAIDGCPVVAIKKESGE